MGGSARAAEFCRDRRSPVTGWVSLTVHGQVNLAHTWRRNGPALRGPPAKRAFRAGGARRGLNGGDEGVGRPGPRPSGCTTGVSARADTRRRTCAPSGVVNADLDCGTASRPRLSTLPTHPLVAAVPARPADERREAARFAGGPIAPRPRCVA